MFRNLLGAAKGALIRAAASTPPLGIATRTAADQALRANDQHTRGHRSRILAPDGYERLGSVATALDESFVLEWPPSNERIRGSARFAQMNAEYPAHGLWQFDLRHLVASEEEVVTDVAITDGVQSARAISFFSFRQGKIARLVEFWPEPYAPPANRAHLVESLA